MYKIIVNLLFLIVPTCGEPQKCDSKQGPPQSASNRIGQKALEQNND